MTYEGADRRHQDDSRHGVEVQLAALGAEFKASQKDVGSRMDRLETTLSRSVDEIKETLLRFQTEVRGEVTSMKSQYVTQDQFTPVRNVVYGLVGLILTTVIGALVHLVVAR